MAYIGNKPKYSNVLTFNTSGDGNTTQFTLPWTPASIGTFIVFVSGVQQRPITDYTIVGNVLTFTTAPAAVGIFVYSLGQQGIINVLAEGSIISGELTNTATSALQVPVGTTSQRPTGADGKIRYNSDLDEYEGYNGSEWTSLGGGGAAGGGSDEIFHLNGQTITSDYSIPAGQNAISAGPISIDANATVTIPADSCWTVFGR